MSRTEDRDLLTLSIRPFQDRKSQGGRCYLMVFEEGSVSTFHIPPAGSVVIGRSPEAHLRIGDISASRRHAQLTLTEEGVRIVDLGSHNGTRVNGEPVLPGSATGAGRGRLLVSGDVISICNVTLVFHIDARRVARRALLLPAQLRLRVEEEIERSLRYHRPLALLCVRFAEGRVDRHRISTALTDILRLIDAASFIESRLVVLLPEFAREEAGACCERMLEALTHIDDTVRAGLSICPADGCDVDTLLASAAAAAQAARPGEWADASAATVTYEIAGQRVVMADPAMLRLYSLVEKLAQSDLPVLIHGETGAGKEMVAAALHAWSRRREGRLVSINCAALPENLVESELFGHERGAFSGAVQQKLGLFEAASGGTVFLDEVGELPVQVQAKLLRVLESRRITRVGDVRERPIDIRLVAATNRDLREEVQAGRFRQDLLFRLSAATLALPPLRDRPRDLPALVRSFLSRASGDGRTRELSPETLEKLFAYPFPGNVRELKNAIDYALATSTDEVIHPWHLPAHIAALPAPPAPEAEPREHAGEAVQPAHFRPIDEEIRELERTRMTQALAATGGVQTRAAELIGMPLRTFVSKLKVYQISARDLRRG